MSAIDVKNLSYAYAKDKDDPLYILNDLSFSINKGEYVSIIGHNGSGKSTLMKLLIGLFEPLSGEIYIMDEKMDEKSVDRLRLNLGIVFQNPDNQFIGATVKDDIAFGLENHCVPHENMHPIVLEYAKKVGMDKYLDKEPSALSGGQKQRVALASALCMKPNILLLDEATAMLDPKGRREIIELAHKMKKENPDMTIISVTHHMDEAYLSDRVIVLNKGQILLDNTPKKVFENEEVLKRIGLDLPFNLALTKSLKKAGFSIEIDEEESEVINKLCR